jgi:tetratricopeptide (TPR) repeat protein
MSRRSSHAEERDSARWEAVEEASELVAERSFEEALRALKAVVEKDAQNAYAYNLMGAVFWELKQLEPARDAFRAAVLSSPSYLGARVSLSHTLRRLRDPVQAEREARLAIARAGDDGDAHHALGLALLAQGKRDLARRSLAIFLDSKPEFEAAQEVRGILAMMEEGSEGEPLDTDEDDD